jgi:hypothetical protein
MTSGIDDSISVDALSRYIDRFLFAEGWRVSDVGTVDGDYEVTLTKASGAGEGERVTHRAPSAGEATFKACGLARKLRLEG